MLQRFLTGDPKYKWLTRLQCVSVGTVFLGELTYVYDVTRSGQPYKPKFWSKSLLTTLASQKGEPMENDSLVQWTEEQWNLVQQTVRDEARKVRIAASFLRVHGPRHRMQKSHRFKRL